MTLRLITFFILLATFTQTDSWAITAKHPSFKIPAWSDSEKYQSKSGIAQPMKNKTMQVYLAASTGLKNGYGSDLQICAKLNRYLCAGARAFVGSLNSSALVRSPFGTETAPNSTDYAQLLASPEKWTAVIPEIGFGVNTQIIPLSENLWSESAWFGVGKFISGKRNGWTFAFEGGINHRFAQKSPWGFSVRGKYNFGWLTSSNNQTAGVPIDWSTLSVGVIYVW